MLDGREGAAMRHEARMVLTTSGCRSFHPKLTLEAPAVVTLARTRSAVCRQSYPGS